MSKAAARSTTSEEEIAEHVRALLQLVDRYHILTLEQVRQILVRHFNYRVRVDVFDEAIRRLRGRR
jgi:hypothetical protein